MKNVAKVLVLIAVIVTILAVISKLAPAAVMGMGSRALTSFSVLLLLFAIALEGLQ